MFRKFAHRLLQNANNRVLVVSRASYNNIKIELISKRLHEHLFGKTKSVSEAVCSQVPSTSRMNEKTFVEQLRERERESNEEAEDIDLTDKIELPRLRAEGDMMAHFEAIGNEQFGKYKAILDSGKVMGKSEGTLPKFPDKWVLRTGWTAYDSEGAVSVEFPDEQLLFFDVEICVKDGQLPVLAVALSPTKWYSWCSDRMVNNTPVPQVSQLHHLIPLEAPLGKNKRKGGTPLEKVVIGHNIAFDRARIREQYYSSKTPTKFWDTMSMSIAISGMADHQRIVFETSDASGGDSKVFQEGWVDDWRLRVCRNSLESVHSKYCIKDDDTPKLDKSLVDAFVNNSIDDIRGDFQALTQYCANDVLATYEVYQELYPRFLKRFPSPVTYWGMMEMAGAYLPITKNWRNFFDACDKVAAEKRNGVAQELAECADGLTCWLANKKYEEDPWMWVSDWSTKKTYPDKPNWFLNFFKSNKMSAHVGQESLEAEHLKMLNRDLPRIFGICYGPYPLFHKAAFGWGFLVPVAQITETEIEEKQKVWLKRGDQVTLPTKAILEEIEANKNSGMAEVLLRTAPVARVGIFNFYRLPHPSGSALNVGSPFAKDYATHFAERVLWAKRFDQVLTNMMASRSETRFWGNYRPASKHSTNSFRQRFQEQLAIWLDESGEVGAIAPTIIPAGTVTRRAVHKLWLVSANSKQEMIGSDLKSMIECTEGFKMVGADVDSQEQWIAALFGDSAFGSGRAGETPFSNMLLAGEKSNQTDLHSVVARQANISRDHAKVLNYSRLYGAGENHAREFLKLQGISSALADTISQKLFSATKGNKNQYYELNPDYINDFKTFLVSDCPMTYRKQHMCFDGRYFLPVYEKLMGYDDYMPRKINSEQSLIFEERMMKKQGLAPNKIYSNYGNAMDLYKGGFESYTFNYLELKSREAKPVTPILGCRLSRSLEPLPSTTTGALLFSKRYKRSVINWFVQSSAVDFLHMLLVSMSWLCSEYNIDARLMLSIHDEVRYLVKEEDKYRCALALALSNMYVRSAISSKLGINELPKSIAFFSQVDIDTVLRKEVNTKCVTPLGHEVPPGEAVDIKRIIEMTGGQLRKAERENSDSVEMPTAKVISHGSP